MFRVLRWASGQPVSQTRQNPGSPPTTDSGAQAGPTDSRRAKPLGAYIATAGSLILAGSMWLDWVGLGPSDAEADFSSGYEADSLIPFMGLLGVGFSLAMLYAAKRADRGQHRGLSLASFAVGLASLVWIVFFLIDPIETLKYDGANGEEQPNVTTAAGLFVGLLGALLWTVGSFLLAKEPEGDVEESHVVHATTARPALTETRVRPTEVTEAHEVSTTSTHAHDARTDGTVGATDADRLRKTGRK